MFLPIGGMSLDRDIFSNRPLSRQPISTIRIAVDQHGEGVGSVETVQGFTQKLPVVEVSTSGHKDSH